MITVLLCNADGWGEERLSVWVMDRDWAVVLQFIPAHWSDYRWHVRPMTSGDVFVVVKMPC